MPHDFRGRFALVPAVYVLLLLDRHVLLCRRANTGHEDGRLGLPSGHLEGDEEVTAAAVREAHEETGVEIDRADVHVVGVMHRRTGEPGHERVDFFTMARWRGEARNCEPEKCSELVWCDAAALPVDVIGYVRRAIGLTLASPGAVWFESYAWDRAAT